MDPELLALIVDFYRPAERQGPGSDETTKAALRAVGDLPTGATILDVGCGTGVQTLVLAASTQGHVTAVDLLPDFLKEVDRRAAQAGLSGRITTVEASMEELPVPDGSFDLLWAEGSIYHIGIERGFREWKRLLKPEGSVAVTEVSWLTERRPTEIQVYWDAAYPLIATVPDTVARIEAQGYELVSHFVLPESCWTDHYYGPIEARMEAFRQKYRGNEMASQFLAEVEEEIRMYQAYKAFYGYVFYVAKPVATGTV